MIDVHILTMPYENKQWLQACLKSLESEPVVTHVIPGIKDNICAARKQAFTLGECSYVSAVDPDDLVLPGCFSSALEILESNPEVAGTYCFEYVVGEKLVLSEGSVNRTPHHAMVFRREILEPLLSVLDSMKLVKPIRDKYWRIGEWQELFSAVATRHLVVEIPKPYYIWRRHLNSFTGKGV